MGFWDAVTGRSRPKQADLDALFLVPSAGITLETSIGLTPTGDGSVCYRAAAGSGFHGTQEDILELARSGADAPDVRVTDDEFGYTWLEIDREPGAPLDGLCTALHGVNTSLEAEGFGTGLLCSLVPFADKSGQTVGLVYLYKQGTFYPFAPQAGGHQQRDNLLEIQVRDALTGELPMEKDLSRWLALWGAPGL